MTIKTAAANEAYAKLDYVVGLEEWRVTLAEYSKNSMYLLRCVREKYTLGSPLGGYHDKIVLHSKPFKDNSHIIANDPGSDWGSAITLMEGTSEAQLLSDTDVWRTFFGYDTVTSKADVHRITRESFEPTDNSSRIVSDHIWVTRDEAVDILQLV